MTAPRPLVAVMALVAAAVTALTAVATVRVSDRTALQEAGEAAVAAANSAIPVVLAYDYRHLEQSEASAHPFLSPRFRTRYDQTMARAVEPLAEKSKAITTAEVTSAGLVEASADRAVVLVFVSQTSTNNQLAAPRLDRPRMRVSMVRTADGWKVDGLDPI